MAKTAAPAPKNAAAAEARAKAQAQLRAQERKTAVVIWASVIVAIALFAGLVAFIVSQSRSVDLDGDVAVPSAATAAGGLPVGMSGVVGEDLPEGVPVVRVYLDFLCGVCGQFEALVGADLDALREAGTIRLEYHPVSILDRNSPTQYSTRAANAAATVAEGSPEHLVPFMAVLFENQPTSGDGHWTNAQLGEFAVEVGVPQETADAIADGTYRGWVASASEQASIDGMQGTPTVMVNGEILDPREISYFEPGVLRSLLEALAAQA